MNALTDIFLGVLSIFFEKLFTEHLVVVDSVRIIPYNAVLKI